MNRWNEMNLTGSFPKQYKAFEHKMEEIHEMEEILFRRNLH